MGVSLPVGIPSYLVDSSITTVMCSARFSVFSTLVPGQIFLCYEANLFSVAVKGLIDS